MNSNLKISSFDDIFAASRQRLWEDIGNLKEIFPATRTSKTNHRVMQMFALQISFPTIVCFSIVAPPNASVPFIQAASTFV